MSLGVGTITGGDYSIRGAGPSGEKEGTAQKGSQLWNYCGHNLNSSTSILRMKICQASGEYWAYACPWEGGTDNHRTSIFMHAPCAATEGVPSNLENSPELLFLLVTPPEEMTLPEVEEAEVPVAEVNPL